MKKPGRQVLNEQFLALFKPVFYYSADILFSWSKKVMQYAMPPYIYVLQFSKDTHNHILISSSQSWDIGVDVTHFVFKIQETMVCS